MSTTHRCKVDVLRPRALDGSGWPIDMANACEGCQGCANRQGDIGLAGGARVIGAGNDLQLEWACPGCGRPVVEKTSALTTHADAERVARDPLGHCCRSRATKSLKETP